MSATALINSSRFMQQSSQGIILQGFQPKPADLTTKPSVEQRVDSAAGFVKFDDTDDGSSLVAPAEPTKSLFQRMTQPKVLIGVGIALTTIAAIGAAYAFPVATAAHAMTIGHAARSTLIHTHAFLQPGLAANALILDMALKTAGVGASLALPVITPAVSTAIVGVLGGIALIYIANKVWEASKVVVCGTASLALKKVNESLCQSGPGWLLKNYMILPIYSGASSLFFSPAETDILQPVESEEKQPIVAKNPEQIEETSHPVTQPVTTGKNTGLSPPAAVAATVLSLGLMGVLFHQSGMSLSDFSPIEAI